MRKKAIVFTNVMVAAAPLEVCQEKFSRTTKEFCSKHSCLTLLVTKPMMTSKPYRKNTAALQWFNFAFSHLTAMLSRVIGTEDVG